MLRNHKNIKFFLNYFLGPILFVWFSISIYRQVQNQPDLESALKNIKAAIQGDQSWKFWSVVLLMLVNWGIEALKWQSLLKPLEQVSYTRAFKAILAGLAFALNTPNRMGEYGGRVLYAADGHRVQAASLSIAGSFSQLIVTMICGCGGLVFLLNVETAATVAAKNQSYLFWVKIVLYIIAALSILALLVYFRLGQLFRWLESSPRFATITRHVAVMKELDNGLLTRVLVLSFLRYIVFVVQYVLMLQLMQVEVTAGQAFWLISVLFLLLAVLPTIALADLGIRGQASLELFGLFSANKLGIITASAGIWCINLVFPALIGSVLIAGIKIFDNK